MTGSMLSAIGVTAALVTATACTSTHAARKPGAHGYFHIVPPPSCQDRPMQGPAQPASTPAIAWDFNGDGRADVAAHGDSQDDESPGGRAETIYLSAANGAIGCRDVFPLQHRGYFDNYASADVNGDGRADLIASTNNQVVTVYLGSATGIDPQSSVDIRSPLGWSEFGQTLATADFNRDGYGDLAVGAYFVNDPLFYRPGGGLCDNHVSADHTGCIQRPRKGESIYVFYGSPSGLATRPVTRIRPPNSTSMYFGAHITAGDLTGDGYPDLVESYLRGKRRPNDPAFDVSRTDFIAGGRQGFARPAQVLDTGSPLGIGDVEGDATNDLVTTSHHRLVVLRGTSSGLATPRDEGYTGKAFLDVLVDVNADGHLDASLYGNQQDPDKRGGGWTVAGSADGLQIGRSLRLPGSPGTGSRCSTIGASAGGGLGRDLNGDGRLDIISGGYVDDCPPSYAVYISNDHGYRPPVRYLWFHTNDYTDLY